MDDQRDYAEEAYWRAFQEEPYATCPACGECIDYCQGHGEIGDPSGYAILLAHDEDDHTECDPHGCDVKAGWLADESEGY